MMVLDAFSLIFLAGVLLVLVILSIIDLRVRLLPNPWVLAFAALGIGFHLCLAGRTIPVSDIALGAMCGFGVLYTIRAVANWFYKQDSLGLGDVKLMGAAGLWLGVEGVLFALTLGALAGLLHGFGYGLYTWARQRHAPDFSRLAIPAGPGFAVGIVLTAAWMYSPLIMDIVHDLLP